MDPVVYFEHNTDSPIWRWKSYVPSGQIEASLAYIMRINQFNCVRHCLQNPPNMILIRYIVMYYRHPSETIVEQLPWNQIGRLKQRSMAFNIRLPSCLLSMNSGIFFSKTKIFNKKTRLDMIITPYIFTLLSKSFRSMQFRFGFCSLENMFVWAKKREMFVIFILLLSCSCFTILWPFRIRNIHSFNDFEYLRRKFGVLSTIQAAARL